MLSNGGEGRVLDK